MNRFFLLFAFVYLLSPLMVMSQGVSLSYYLPDMLYDEKIQTPESFLDYQIGDWHVSHDQLKYYLRSLASSSDRISYTEYGESHEGRPLIALMISSPDNLKRLDQIKNQHKELCQSHENSKDIRDIPTVIYQGYSIHGNESSGANASLLVAYYLAAAKGDEIEKLLKNTVIILDPCLNPDGLHRFATWANANKSQNMNGDPHNRELNEPWPRGRTNHYWFDLNRDWLLLTHPESQGRVKLFQDWRPNVVTDHHEMSSNSTFFFMPGIPSRTNPSTPQKNQDLTGDIATYHAKALDQLGSQYYTKESFDDYYYGKGSTYPDANGSIGILFEQASSRGHLQQTQNGNLSFPFTIRNQVATSLSTQKAALELHDELLEYKRSFYQNARKDSDHDPIKAYVFSSQGDDGKMRRFLNILQTHQIEVYQLNESLRISNQYFEDLKSYIVPVQQEQYRMVKTIFETVNEFPDSLFYDVSTWTMPLAFDLPYAAVNNQHFKNGKLLGKKIDGLASNHNTFPEKQAVYGYIMDWNDFYAPAAINELLNDNYFAKVTTKEFEIKTDRGITKFGTGSIFIPIKNQFANDTLIYEKLKNLSDKYGVDMYACETGLSDSGISLGSPSMKPLQKQKILLITGEGTNSYEAGALWHHLDQNMQIAISKIDAARVNQAHLEKYTTIIIPDGSHKHLTKSVENLKSWVTNGGKLIALRGAINWAKNNGLIKLEVVKSSKPNNLPLRPYACLSADKGSKVTGGAILMAKMDLTHPINYGYKDEDIAFFRRGNYFVQASKNPYANPVAYTSKPLISGYMAQENQGLVSNASVVNVTKMGQGQIISFVDNPVFRGYWWGTSKMLMNAIFFGQHIDRRASAEEE